MQRFSTTFSSFFSLSKLPKSVFRRNFFSLTNTFNTINKYNKLNNKNIINISTRYHNLNKNDPVTYGTYEHLLYAISDNGIGTITLNRPKALNALCVKLLDEIVDILHCFDHDNSVKCIIITGSGNKAFCAGADIKEMESKSYMDAYNSSMFSISDSILQNIKKPIIAAVNGYALGGGCELAMICDIIVASDKAKFGQPEINLGTIPGIGGTQRLTRAIGKSRSMELCLTGDMITSEQASDWGLVSKVVPQEECLNEANKIAEKIASKSQPIVKLAKECINFVYESSLSQGILFERRLFHSTFGTKDQKEGMNAFSNKKTPQWSHE